MRIRPGNARWFALSAGVVLLSVVLSLVAGAFGWIAAHSADLVPTHQVVARVVTALPCNPPGGMERVKFTLDGREHQANLDACGHEPDEPIDIRVSSATDLAVPAAEAASGQGRYGRRLGELLLILAGVSGAGYTLLLRRGPRGTPMPVLGTLDRAQPQSAR